MKKMMFSFVGEQDPYSEKTEEEGSVVTLCRKIRPDIVYLFPTAGGHGVRSETQSNADLTRDWIVQSVDPNVEVFIRPMVLNDPTDFTSVIPAVRRAVDEVLSAVGMDEFEIHINCSSGTPQLKNTWLILANGGVFSNCHLWQVANPRYAPAERVREIEITFLEEENILTRLKQYTREFQFKQMAEESLRLKQISAYSYRREKAALLHRLFLAYHCWDLIQYPEAHQRLNGVLNEIRRTRDLQELTDLLERQLAVLAKLKENRKEEGPENLVDLYYNACRRLRRNDYTDTLARFWRLYEGLLYWRIREVFGLEPTELSRSSNPERFRQLIEFAAANPSRLNPNIQKLNLRQAETLLAEVLKDRDYLQAVQLTVAAQRSGAPEMMKLRRLLDELRERRNQSIVAHGMEPVNEKDAANCIAAMETLLRYYFGENGLMADYPFQEGEVERVVSVLSRAFAC